MKTYNYVLTLTANLANASESVIISVSQSELSKLREIINNRKYTPLLTQVPQVDNTLLTFKETKKWVETVKLYKTEYVLSKVLVDVIHLPNGIQFNSEGYLEINLGKTFLEIHHDDAVRENELAKWVLTTFPTAEYCHSRSRFTLPTNREEWSDKRHTTKYVFSISASGNEAIEVTKRIYKKVNVEL